MKKLLTFLLFCLPLLSLAQDEIKLSSTEKKKLNTFFSNFSEAGMKNFKAGASDDKVLHDFGIMHNLLNREKSLKKSADGNSVIITSAQIDSATEKYFGKKISHHSSKSYTLPMASGEAYTFSQIRRLSQTGTDLYLADGVIFVTGSGGTPNPHGTEKEWKEKGEEVELSGNFTAKIQMIRGRYILREYTVTPR